MPATPHNATSALPWLRWLATGLFACVAWTFTSMVLSLGLDLPSALTTALTGLAVWIVGIHLGARTTTTHRDYRRYTAYSLVEWFSLLVPLVVALQFLPLLAHPATSGETFARWAANPWAFWGLSLWWRLALMLLLWDRSLCLAVILATVPLQPGELPSESDHAGTLGYYEWVTDTGRFVLHATAWRSLVLWTMWGGCLLVLFAGLSMVPVQALTDLQRPERSGIVAPVVVYCLLGLLLVGQSHLERRRAEWLRDGATVQVSLPRQWVVYGAALVVAAIVVSLFLPTTFVARAADQLPLAARVLWYLSAPVRFVLSLLIGAVLWLMMLFMALLAMLFPAVGGQETTPGAPAVPPLPPAAATPPPAGPNRFWHLLLVLLPLSVVLMGAYLAWQERFRLRRALLAARQGRWAVLWQALGSIGAALWALVAESLAALWALWQRAPLPDFLTGRRSQRQVLTGEGGRWQRQRAPRALIAFFYLSLARRAGELGWARRRGQTAYEYSRSLAERLPEHQTELDALTDAFVRARYSPGSVTQEDAQRARTPWQRLRAALRARATSDPAQPAQSAQSAQPAQSAQSAQSADPA